MFLCTISVVSCQPPNLHTAIPSATLRRHHLIRLKAYLITHLIILLINMAQTKSLNGIWCLSLWPSGKLQTGKKHIYSIKFADKQGVVIRFFPQAYTTGSGRGNDYVNRMRGVQPCCLQGNPEGHIYPVSIDRIFEFNGMKVKL